MKRLRDAEVPLANFFASGMLALRAKLGPVLWRLPPSFAFDPERLTRFFTQLPRTTREAGRLAKKHDGRLNGRSYSSVDADRPIRHALKIGMSRFAIPPSFGFCANIMSAWWWPTRWNGPC